MAYGKYGNSMSVFLIMAILAQGFWNAQCHDSGYSKQGNAGVVEWLKPGTKITFDAPEIPHTGLLNRLHWVEKNERSTSSNYTLWEKADVYLLEWPGNITEFKPDKPVVKWGRNRAKHVEDYCGEEFNGIEMRAYAYKYVYLTWGPYRLTKTYTPPLTVPRSVLPFNTVGRLPEGHTYEENELTVVTVFDIAFSFDSFLLAFSDGIIKISGLEMGWAELSRTPKWPLKYSLSKGVNYGVDKLVTQSCCTKTEFCPFGDVVIAYKEQSLPHIIYFSKDGGESFAQVKPLSRAFGHLKIVLCYPEFNQLVIFQGNSSNVKLNRLILFKNESSHYKSPKEESSLVLRTNGSIQGSRLGAEASLLLWDDCNVWYSSNIGFNITKSLFYVHKKIMNSGKGTTMHHIIPECCVFGKNSMVAFGKTGQFGLLDADNVFYLGIDTKTNLSQLVALKVDMSAMTRNSKLSITPYFDMQNQPKLLYPPKFLRLPKTIEIGKNYYARLGMRILPKNIYPSDFMLSFYEENMELPFPQQFLALAPCQTSSLQNITVRPRTATALNRLFRVNFYTKNGLRCNLQPRVPIYIKVQNTTTINFHLPSDDDMKETVYLKSVTGDGEPEYLDTSKMGETIKVETCPLTRAVNTGK
ncbi:unnamed protein product [Orchesella dallaii]|uniref:Uncharacterized protein n=1 Tax=Orchesella dallaii TaxID=48710 RepID=A0ABP1QG33_9HEXA